MLFLKIFLRAFTLFVLQATAIEALPRYLEEKVEYFEWVTHHPFANVVSGSAESQQALRELLAAPEKKEIFSRMLKLLGACDNKCPAHISLAAPIFVLSSEELSTPEQVDAAIADLNRFIENNENKGDYNDLLNPESKFAYALNYFFSVLISYNTDNQKTLGVAGKALGKTRIAWQLIEAKLQEITATDLNEGYSKMIDEIILAKKDAAFLEDWRKNVTEKLIADIQASFKDQNRRYEFPQKLARLSLRGFDPNIRKFLKESLGSSEFRENRDLYASLILLAYAAPDKELKSMARSSLRDELLGLSAIFVAPPPTDNPFPSMAYASDHARYEYESMFPFENEENFKIQKELNSLKEGLDTPEILQNYPSLGAAQNEVFDVMTRAFFMFPYLSSYKNKFSQIFCDLMLELHQENSELFNDPLLLKRLSTYAVNDRHRLNSLAETFLRKTRGEAYLAKLRIGLSKKVRVTFLNFVQAKGMDPFFRFPLSRYYPHLKEFEEDPQLISAIRKVILDNNADQPWTMESYYAFGVMLPSLREIALVRLQDYLDSPEKVQSFYFKLKNFFPSGFEEQGFSFIRNLFEELQLPQEFLSRVAEVDRFARIGLQLKRPPTESENMVAILRSGFKKCGEARSPESPSIEEFNTSTMGFLKFLYLENVRDMIRENLQRALQCRDQRMVGPFVMAGFLSQDLKLIAYEQKVLRDYIRLDFNPYAPAEKLLYLFSVMQKTLAAYNQYQGFMEMVEDQLLGALPENTYLDQELEEVSRSKKVTSFVSFAQKWMRRAGKESRLKDFALKDAHKTTAVYINGGYSFTKNSQIQEEDLKSFNYGIFGSRAALFSGDGPKGYVTVPRNGGDFVLQPESSYIERKPTTIKEDFAPATRKNVESYFDLLSGKRNLERVHVVYGGHGDENGLALWGGDYFTASDINDMYRKFDPKTLITSIYLQCFAGATVVVPGRPIPRQLVSEKKFLDIYYPANRCAFAISTHDELGTYYANYVGHDWQQGAWTKLFQELPYFSLNEIKKRIQLDNAAITTPVSTSDYFEEDLRQTLCSEYAEFKDFKANYGLDPKQWSPEVALQFSRLSAEMYRDHVQQVKIARLCDSPDINEWVESAKEITDYFSNFRTIALIKASLSKDLIAEYYPEIVQHPQNVATFEKLKPYKVVDKKTMRLSTKEMIESLKLGSLFTEEYQLLTVSVPVNPKFKPLMDLKFREILKKNPNLFSDLPFAKEMEKGIPESINLLDRVEGEVLNKLRNYQNDRKKKDLRIRPVLRQQLEQILEHPKLIEIKERYQNIRACERAQMSI